MPYTLVEGSSWFWTPQSWLCVSEAQNSIGLFHSHDPIANIVQTSCFSATASHWVYEVWIFSSRCVCLVFFQYNLSLFLYIQDSIPATFRYIHCYSQVRLVYFIYKLSLTSPWEFVRWRKYFHFHLTEENEAQRLWWLVQGLYRKSVVESGKESDSPTP